MIFVKNIISKNYLTVFIGLFILSLFLVPQLSFAEVDNSIQNILSEGLVHCGKAGQDSACRFTDLYVLINRLVVFGLFLVIPIGTISIAIAGFKLILFSDNEGERKKAKDIIKWVVIGMVMALAAWLIIDTIVDALVNREQFTPPEGF